MSDNQKLVYSIIKFLKKELTTLSPEACESIEVAIQCLENAYEVNADKTELDTGTPLEKVFEEHVMKSAPAPATDAEKLEAEELKIRGNNLMKDERFQDALDCYTKAIKLDGNNPVYYCNRAAAHSRLNNHQATIEDCQAALKIEPSYSKAYGRLGLAYTSLKMYNEARTSYQKALELEPGNQTYLNNLQLNEEQIKSQSNQAVNGLPRIPNMEGFDFNAFLSNPSLISIASQMLSDPTMQNMMSSVMSENISESRPGIEALLEAGQMLAQHMQAANPTLVEQLRMQMTNTGGNPNANADPNPNPNPDSKNESEKRNQ